MKVLNKITVRNLKLNKTRTIVTIVGIILVTSFICATIGIVSSLHKSLVNAAIRDTGDYHVIFKDLDSNSLNEVKNDKNNEYYYYVNEIGYSKIETNNKNKNYARIVEYDSKALKNNNIIIVEGRLPKNSNEIVIQTSVVNDGYKYNIGDKVNLKLQKEMGNIDEEDELINEELDDNIQVIEIDEEIEKEEIFDENEYEIVGIIEPLGYVLEDSYMSRYNTFITFNDDIKNASEVFVKYKNVLNTKKNICKISIENKNDYNKCLNDDETIKYNKTYELNEDILLMYGVGIETKTKIAILLLLGVMLSVICICCIIIIKNSFLISVNERYKQYGMLSSIGSTRSQLLKNVLFEGLIEGLISIPIGILLGSIVTYILVNVTNNILLQEELIGAVGLSYSLPPLAIFIVVIATSLTIFFSCLFPALKISKISPMEAIKNNNEINIKKNKLKTSKLIKKFFGIGGVLADKNLKRSRKKYRTIVISITISIILYLILSFGTKIIKEEIKEQYTGVNYNFEVFIYDDDIKSGNENIDIEKSSIFEKIASHSSVSKYAYLKEFDNVSITYNDLSDDYKKYILNEEGSNHTYENLDYPIQIYIVNDQEMKRINDKLTDEELKSTLLFKNEILIKDDKNKEKNIKILNGDNKISLIIKDEEQNIKETFDVNIVSSLNLKESLIFGSDYYFDGFIASESFIKEHSSIDYNITNNLYIYSTDTESFTNYIKTLSSNFNFEYGIMDLEEDYAFNKKIILIINIFTYTFIGIIALIAITNIFNTISTNMMLRKKEFAMLRAMGMTDKEFKYMIILESILYAVKALIYGLVISIIILYLIINSEYGEDGLTIIERIKLLLNYLPYLQILISIIVVIMVILVTMFYSINKINKQNIIETIRNDNI